MLGARFLSSSADGRPWAPSNLASSPSALACCASNVLSRASALTCCPFSSSTRACCPPTDEEGSDRLSEVGYVAHESLNLERQAVDPFLKGLSSDPACVQSLGVGEGFFLFAQNLECFASEGLRSKKRRLAQFSELFFKLSLNMRKLRTLFVKDEDHFATEEPNADWEDKDWVAHRKYDGTSCAVIGGVLYKRFDYKRHFNGRGEELPEGAIECCDADPVTGHWPHWVPVTHGGYYGAHYSFEVPSTRGQLKQQYLKLTSDAGLTGWDFLKTVKLVSERGTLQTLDFVTVIARFALIYQTLIAANKTACSHLAIGVFYEITYSCGEPIKSHVSSRRLGSPPLIQKRVCMRNILTKWDNVCNDESWISSLLSWYEVNSLAVRVESFQRPAVFETTLFDRQALVIKNLQGDLFAKYTCLSGLIVPPNLLFDRTHTHPMRPSDQHVWKITPHALYYHLMCSSVREEHAVTVCAELAVSSQQPPHNQVRVRVAHPTPTVWWFTIHSCDEYDTVLCVGRFETELGNVEPRYDRTRLVSTSKQATINASASRELLGRKIIEVVPFFEFELFETNAGTGWLHLADIAVCEVWEHLFFPESEMYTNLQSNGERKFGCMWRGAAAQVFDPTAVRLHQAFECMVWLDRTGGSTCNLRADFYAFQALVCSVQFTLITVDLTTMKPRPVFYTKEWAEARYTYGKQSPVQSESFTLPVIKKSWINIPLAHTYKLHLRHADQDVNGHVNSGRYMKLVEDARLDWLAPKPWGDWIKSFWIEYNQELHMEADECAYIEIKQQTLSSGREFIQFEFMRGARKVCSVVTVECRGASGKL
ncbi:hypothetical protein BASA81_004773 [Batrachochytrium salamandrivorans]|nr:hypothetical protein BASA81_004773 [Batrachochytrium salamandrivorans]